MRAGTEYGIVYVNREMVGSKSLVNKILHSVTKKCELQGENEALERFLKFQPSAKSLIRIGRRSLTRETREHD
jgi:hypothetical protein